MDGGNEVLFLPDKREQIEDTTQYPYCCIGLVMFQLKKKKCAGTGCLISGRIVLTAAHNIYDRNKKLRSTNITFAPGVNGKKDKEYEIVDYCYPEEYEKEEKDENAWEYDYCILLLEKDLGDEHGWVGIDASYRNIEGVEQIEVVGYPGDKIE